MNKVTLTTKALSAEVARRLFGIEYAYGPECPLHHTCKPYAEDHNAAMGLVVPEMTAQGFEFRMIVHRSDGSVFVEFYNERVQAGEMVDSIKEAPRAICEAALAALDAEGGK